jgi:nitroreductase
MSRSADTDAALIDPIAQRWSPRAFADRDIPEATLQTLLEAARWAPSCFNEQPWRFMLARRSQPEAHAQLAGVLVEQNRLWAKAAPILLMSVARTTFAMNGRTNPHAWHDVGLAVSQLIIQATAMDICAHQMAGFDRDAARAAFQIPGDFEPVAIIALGYRGDPGLLSAALAEREKAPRKRRPLSETVFTGHWKALMR